MGMGFKVDDYAVLGAVKSLAAAAVCQVLSARAGMQEFMHETVGLLHVESFTISIALFVELVLVDKG